MSGGYPASLVSPALVDLMRVLEHRPIPVLEDRIVAEEETLAISTAPSRLRARLVAGEVATPCTMDGCTISS